MSQNPTIKALEALDKAFREGGTLQGRTNALAQCREVLTTLLQEIPAEVTKKAEGA